MGQQTNGGLTVTLPSDHEIVMTRVFDAPRELVFAAHSKCEHLKRWWGRGNPLDCDLDFRPGGRYRFVEHAPDGGHYGFRGEYREIVPPERIVYTFEFEGMPGHVCVDTLTLTEEDGKTTLTSTTRFESVEDRDGMLASGMETGAAASLDHLAELLRTMV
ncbi:MAG TPA: SRPBCC family protein [Catenuloplanes sp.]|jgi:uncharacterized protein YndB with AHSA1/START domain